MQNLAHTEIEQLISLVRENEIIYNPRHPHFNMQILKEQLWRKIAAEIKIPEEHAKNAWHSLRDSFMRYNINTRNSDGTSPNYRKPYTYYDHLLFLNETMSQRRTEETNELLAHEKSTTSLPASNTVKSSCSSDSYSSESHIPLKRRKREQSTEAIEDDMQKLISSVIGNTKKDEIGLFMQSQAKSLQKLNLSLAEFYNIQLVVLNTVKDKLVEMRDMTEFQ